MLAHSPSNWNSVLCSYCGECLSLYRGRHDCSAQPTPVADDELTPRQRQVYLYVAACLQEQQRPPSLYELCDHLEVSGSQVPRDILQRLQRKGYLLRDQRARSTQLAGVRLQLVPLAGEVGERARVILSLGSTLDLPCTPTGRVLAAAVRLAGALGVKAGDVAGCQGELKAAVALLQV